LRGQFKVGELASSAKMTPLGDQNESAWPFGCQRGGLGGKKGKKKPGKGPLFRRQAEGGTQALEKFT